MIREVAIALVVLAAPAVLRAQDTLRLPAMQEAAIRSDPRGRQRELLRSATDLRQSVIGSDRLPRLTVSGWASHQSDVTQPEFGTPGVTFPEFPKDRWQSTLDVEQPVYDGGDVSRRRAVEQARHAESEAGVTVALYELRSEVNSAFYSAFLLDKRSDEFEALACGRGWTPAPPSAGMRRRSRRSWSGHSSDGTRPWPRVGPRSPSSRIWSANRWTRLRY
jgi:outer membrane protein TolC